AAVVAVLGELFERGPHGIAALAVGVGQRGRIDLRPVGQRQQMGQYPDGPEREVRVADGVVRQDREPVRVPVPQNLAHVGRGSLSPTHLAGTVGGAPNQERRPHRAPTPGRLLVSEARGCRPGPSSSARHEFYATLPPPPRMVGKFPALYRLVPWRRAKSRSTRPHRRGPITALVSIIPP